MKYRLVFTVLLSILFASLSMNYVQYDSLDMIQKSMDYETKCSSTIIDNLHKRLIAEEQCQNCNNES